MKLKNAIAAVLLLFVAASVAFLAFQEPTSRTDPPGRKNPEDRPTGQVTAYYFHGKARCVTCRRLEAYAGEALQAGFPQELADGRLAWRTVDTRLPENRHFIADYAIHVQSLILVEMKDGRQQRWKNLDQIWQKVRDKEAYLGYVQEETRAYLGD